MAKPAYAILNTKKLKSAGKVSIACAHFFRTIETKNADPSRFNMNKVLVGNDQNEFMSNYRNSINSLDTKVRSDAVHVMEIMMTASGHGLKYPDGKINEDALAKFTENSLAWLKKEFTEKGAEIAGVILHCDETTPHIHALIVPTVTKKHKKGMKKSLSAKNWLDGGKKLADLQTSFANAQKDVGLVRGVESSGAKHTSIKSFYGDIKTVKPPPPPTGFVSKARAKKWQEENSKEVMGTTILRRQHNKIKKNYQKELHSKIDQIKKMNANLAKKSDRLYEFNEKLKGIDKDILDKALSEARIATKEKQVQIIERSKKSAQERNLALLELNSKEVNQSEREAVNKNRANPRLDDTDLGL
jgi:hypothetical protein